jgi:hypothetical protein
MNTLESITLAYDENRYPEHHELELMNRTHSLNNNRVQKILEFKRYFESQLAI